MYRMLNATLFARVILGSNNIVGGVTVGILPFATSKTSVSLSPGNQPKP